MHGGADQGARCRPRWPLAGYRESIALFICPLTPETSRVWFRLAVADFDSPDEKLRAFQHTIFMQDKPVLESQRPARLPLDRAPNCTRRRQGIFAYRRHLQKHACPPCCAAMPKAELHMHIEGSLEPELIFALAQRNGVALPYPSVEALRRAYAFTNLQSFLDIYYAGRQRAAERAGLLRHGLGLPAARAQADNVVHAEMFFDPQTHTARGVAMATVSTACTAPAWMRKETGHQRLADPVLPAPPERRDAFETLEQALPLRDKFIGVGLDQRSRPPARKVCPRVCPLPRAGLAPGGPCGRRGPAGLHLERAGCAEGGAHRPRRAGHPRRRADAAPGAGPHAAHGVPAVQPEAVRVPHLAQHNLGKLLDAGLMATVNSDDPAYFGGYINENFTQTFAATGLTASTPTNWRATALRPASLSSGRPTVMRRWLGRP
jgi:adenosine deaminase